MGAQPVSGSNATTVLQAILKENHVKLFEPILQEGANQFRSFLITNRLFPNCWLINCANFMITRFYTWSQDSNFYNFKSKSSKLLDTLFLWKIKSCKNLRKCPLHVCVFFLADCPCFLNKRCWILLGCLCTLNQLQQIETLSKKIVLCSRLIRIPMWTRGKNIRERSMHKQLRIFGVCTWL